jgi:hypothetical protein
MSVPLKHYDWKEPGDPPYADYASVRAKPLPKPIKYDPLTPEIELELVCRFREHGDLEALDQLVGAHRPMVVHMAKYLPRGDVPLNVLVEYGLVGLRAFAQPMRPSKTKKGKMVGFDPSLGHRFGTLGREWAKKEMMAALADDPSEPLKADEFPKAAVEAENWHTAPSLRGILPDIPAVIRDLQRRRWQYCSKVVSTLWNPPTWAKDQYERAVKLRDYKLHPRTPRELVNKDAFYGVWRDQIAGFEKIARDGMEGLEDEDERWDIENNFMIASLLRNHAFKGKQFKLPEKVLPQRWRKGCKRQSKIIPFSTNQGLGLFDKYGHPLPDYSCLQGKVVVIRNRPFRSYAYALSPVYT